MEPKANTRVRGVLMTVNDTIMLIRRTRSGEAPYWIFPGGGIEATDANPEEALVREVAEELGGQVQILKLIYILRRPLEGGEVQDELYFLCRLIAWDGTQTGPEFREANRGGYALEEIPVESKSIEQFNIKPEVMKSFLIQNALSLNDLPDLRTRF